MSGIFGYKNLDLDIDKIKSKLLYKQNNGFQICCNNNITFCQCRFDYGNFTENNIKEIELEGNLLAFNGSIYNYKELKQEFLKDIEIYSDSDTEVLLNLLKIYGLEILNKLNGTFSFAYYEKESGSTFLVNDRFGEKELFYYINGNSYAFCSSDVILTEILNIPFEFNQSYIDTLYVKDMIDFEERLVNKNFKTLISGEYIEITRDNNVIKNRYYNFNDSNVENLDLNYKNKKEVINYFENLLTDAIRLRWNKNVPMAITLSSGVDSTLLYTLIKEKLGYNITPFTYANDNKILNEYFRAKQLAEKYNDKIIKIEYSKETFEEDYKNAILALNAPCSISDANFYYFYRKINEYGYNLIIEGHGSDEILCGYAAVFLPAIGNALFRKNYLLAWRILNLYKFNIRRPMNIQEKNEIKEHFIQSKQTNKDTYMQCTDYLIKTYLLPKVLRCRNRILTANSLEFRSPFCDYRVVEFARALPLEYKLNKIGNKAIVREILKKYNIDFIYKNKLKQGFTTSYQITARDKKDFFMQYYDKNRFNLDTSEFNDHVYKACSVGFLENYYKNSNK